MRQYLFRGVFCSVIAVLALRAGAEINERFTNAPRGNDGRFTNLAGEISHGSLAAQQSELGEAGAWILNIGETRQF